MTFLHPHSHHTGITGGHKSLKSMPWAQIIAAVQLSTRRLRSAAVNVKMKREARLS